MANLYTTKTAALKATKADISKLNVKNLSINGEDISSIINDAKTIILDERGTLANDDIDIWNSYISKDVNGNVIINRDCKPLEHTMLAHEPSTELVRAKPFLQQATSIVNNQVLNNDNHLMFWQTSGLVKSHYLHEALDWTFPIDNFESDLSSLTSSPGMFYGVSTLKSFKSNLSSLENGEGMFQSCSNLKTFECENLNSLKYGHSMFYFGSNTSIAEDAFGGSFTYDLPSLESGEYMFCNTKLNSFSSDLSSLTKGRDMFQGCDALTSFTSDLPRLTNGERMFYHCTALTSFSSDLSSLTDGEGMFNYCINLTSFSSYLSSLTDGKAMFYDCKLDAQSVANIIHFIPQRDAKPTSSTDNGNISIGLGITNTDAAKQAFAEECYCNNWEELNKEFDDKNWTVHWQFNGPASYSLRDPRPSTAVYTKLEEVFLPSDEEIATAKENGEHIQIPHYQYTSQDGSKLYNIYWYHESNTNNEGYSLYDSMDVALEALGVIPKV